MSLMMSFSVQVNFLSGLHTSGPEYCPQMDCCVVVSLYLKLQNFKKGAALVLGVSTPKVGGKNGNVSLESYNLIFEETRRIQDPAQFIDSKTQPQRW